MNDFSTLSGLSGYQTKNEFWGIKETDVDYAKRGVTLWRDNLAKRPALNEKS